MDDPRARTDDSVSVALANLSGLIEHTDERALERVKALDRLVEARFTASETALSAAKDALDSTMKAGDQELLSHIQAQKVSVDAALKSLQDLDVERAKAVDKFEQTVTQRFAQVNEFRSALDDLGKDMATRREFEGFKQQYSEAHESLRGQVVGLGSRLDIGNPSIAALQQQQAAYAARSSGFSDGFKFIASALASVLVLISIYIAITTTQNKATRQTPQVVTVTTPTP